MDLYSYAGNRFKITSYGLGFSVIFELLHGWQPRRVRNVFQNLDEGNVATQDLSIARSFLNFSYSRVKTPLAP